MMPWNVGQAFNQDGQLLFTFEKDPIRPFFERSSLEQQNMDNWSIYPELFLSLRFQWQYKPVITFEKARKKETNCSSKNTIYIDWLRVIVTYSKTLQIYITRLR